MKSREPHDLKSVNLTIHGILKKQLLAACHLLQPNINI